MTLKRGFFTFGGWTLVSRAAGFVRDVLVAAVLGAGPLADAFVVAQRLPNLFRNLFAEGALSAAFVPLFTQVRARQGDDAARRFAAETNAALFAVLLVFVGLMMAGMPWVMRVIAPGFVDDPLRFAMAVAMAQATFPYLLLISLTALQGGVLNALGRLAPYAAAPVLYNIIQIAVLLAVVPHAAALGTDAGMVLAVSMAGAGVAQWLLLAWFCRRAGFAVRWKLPRLTDGVRVFLRRLGPGVVGAGAAQINLMISTMLASLLPMGAVAHLYYADRLNQLPLGVIGMAVSTALLPLLAQAVQDGDERKTEQAFSRAIDLGLAFGLPAAVGLAALAEPIFTVLFVRGAYTTADAAQSAMALAGYVAGIPAFILVRLFATRFFAVHDTKTPVRIALVAFAANVAAAVWLMPWLGILGVALATSLATWVNAALLRWRLRQAGLFGVDALCVARAAKFGACSMAMGTALAFAVPVAAPYVADAWWVVRLNALLALVVLGLAVYLAGVAATRALPMADAVRALRLKKGPPPAM